MNTIEYFKNNKEEMPSWLKNYKMGNKLNFDEILENRIIYYPGAYIDGQPIKTYNMAHLAHTFLYTDYMIKDNDVIKNAYSNNSLLGYHLIGFEEFKISDFIKRNVKKHFYLTEDQQSFYDAVRNKNQFGFIGIFERNKEYDESHGQERIALIYLSLDGIRLYDYLFVNRKKAPYLVVLQDHGFGGNYDSFGDHSILSNLVYKHNIYPEYLLCALNTEPWKNYDSIDNVDIEIGGMFHHKRKLYKLNKGNICLGQ